MRFTDVIISLNSINFDTDKSMYTYEDKRDFFYIHLCHDKHI